MKKRKKAVFLLINALLILASIICFAFSRNISGILISQQAAERWKGESDMSYAQISCFIPADQTVTLEQINEFRTVMVKRFEEAALDTHGENPLFTDAWSTSGKVTVSSSLGSGDVYAYAVGGNFFNFHPIRLRSGNYIEAKDLMQDRVILDEATAWLLFGSSDVHGQSFKINGEYFVVAGVIERESDFATKKAYADGMGIFMSYDAYQAMNENAGIQCYEVVMPETVKGFSYGIAADKFPVGRGEVINNSTRFEFTRLLKIAGQYGMRSMQNKGVIYPYWENAARYAEDIAALLTALGTALALLPTGSFIYMIIKLLALGKQRLEEEIFPRWKDSISEAARRRQYARLQRRKKK